jgi:adenylate cyclase
MQPELALSGGHVKADGSSPRGLTCLPRPEHGAIIRAMAVPVSSAEPDDWADARSDAGGVDPEPEQVAVVAALRRMLDSEELRTAPRSRAFLAYVVTEALAGRGHRLKERTVARYALERTQDFDAATDAAVRVQANRLRTSMKRYYAGTGAGEPLLIDLPRGSYSPTFTYRHREAIPREGISLEPGLVVVQFVDMQSPGVGEPLGQALTESLIHALRSFPGLRVIGPAVSERGIGALPDVQAAARALDARYVLTGAVRTTIALVRATVRLSDGETGTVLWSDVCDQERGAVTGFHDEDELVRRIAATVGDFRGVVLRDTTRRGAGTRLPTARAMLSYYRYLDSGTRQDTETAARDLREAVDLDPQNVVLLAMRGNLEYAMAIMRWVPDRDATLADAQRMAQTALRLDPRHALAWTVRAGVAFAQGNSEQCRTDASRAIELSPGHPSILYASGVLLALSGAWDTGLECIRESNRLNPYHPGYQHIYLALDQFMAGDHTAMLAVASLHTHPDDLWGPLMRFLAFAGLGDDDRAGKELNDAVAIEPGLLTDDAALIVDQLHDVPPDIRTTMRQRLLDWLASHPDQPLQAQG